MKNRSWKTTIIGLIIAAGTVALPLIQTGTVDNKSILIAIGFAILGYLSKDFDKSGKPDDLTTPKE
jgi:EamA domain-containing membrane protein RarD